MTESIFEFGADQNDPSDETREMLRKVARYQRLVLYAVLANLIANIVLIALKNSEPPIRLAGLGIGFAVSCFAMIAVFQLTRQLYNAVLGVFFALVMFVPCVALIVLVMINSKATSYLRQHGVRVGFLGANPDRI
jgi:uncharacterized paraquat-inducible protein A